MKLPLLISVPHAGLRVPAEVASYCSLTPQQIVEDSDEGAAEIYDIGSEVEACLTTDVARSIVDLNRAVDDRRPDGVVKTHTCWEAPVYETFPPDDVVEALLSRYHRPYHAALTQLARRGVRCGIDCHTMLAKGPPIGPGPRSRTPLGLLEPWRGDLPATVDQNAATLFSAGLPGPRDGQRSLRRGLYHTFPRFRDAVDPTGDLPKTLCLPSGKAMPGAHGSQKILRRDHMTRDTIGVSMVMQPGVLRARCWRTLGGHRVNKARTAGLLDQHSPEEDRPIGPCSPALVQ